MTEIWYSADRELYCYSDIQEVADAVFSTYGAAVGDTFTVYSGERVDNKASDFVRDIVEDMEERAYDDHGEFSIDWVDATVEQAQELQIAVESLVDEWADKHKLQPTFFRLGNVKEVTLKIVSLDTNEFEVING